MNDSIRLTQDDDGRDKTFADSGVFLLDRVSLGRESILYGVQTQYSASAERIYFTGQARTGVTERPYVLGCLKADGTLDPGFGDNGIASGNFIQRTESAGTSITLLDDGKILLTGWIYDTATPALARFSADGKRDTGFGTDGYVILRRPVSSVDQDLAGTAEKNASQEFSTSVTPLADGKILVGNTYVVTHVADTRAYLFLLNSDGSYDTDFNGTGHVQVIYPGADPAQVKLRSACVDHDGTIVVAGGLVSDPNLSVPLMARYTRDGKLVPGFGTAGFFAPAQTLFKSAEFATVIAQPNKRLLGIGSTDDGRGLLISLEADGKYNIQFNGATPLLTRLDDSITKWEAGAMQPDGKIVLCGAIKPADESSPGVVVRLLDNGALDTTFHQRGWTSTRVDGHTRFYGLALQKDGKIVVAGFRHGDGAFQGLILRYHANGTGKQPSTSNNEGQLDPAFGTHGLVLLNASGTEGATIEPRGLGVDSTGRIYVVGAEYSDRVCYWCMRMSASGVVDRTFGKGGHVTGEFDPDEGGRAHSDILEVVPLPDGKILLIGDHHDGSFDAWVGLVRLLPDGRPDPDFGDKGEVLIPLGSLSADRKLRDENSRATPLAQSVSHGPVLPDGKILVLTQIYDGTEQTQSVVIRFMPNGALDTSFNQTGMVRVAHPDYPHTVLTDMVVDHEGKYALSGYCLGKNHRPGDALFTKLEITGALDTSFATAGYLVVKPNSDELRFFIGKLVAQANRRLLGIGYEQHLDKERGLLISRESDGSANIQFNRGEPLLTRLEGRSTSWSSAATQPDGSILAFGYLFDPGRTVIAKFTDRGELDKTFGAGTGWLQFDVMRGFMPASLLTDHSALCIATVMDNGRRVSCVARGLLTTKSQTLDSAGKPDLEFGTDGTVMINVPDMPLARVSGVGIGPDNKIYCAGNGEDVADPNPRYFLGRFNNDGSVDRSFATSGFAQDIYPDCILSQIKSFTFQPDGNIVIFSEVYAGGQLVPAFSRYDAHGQLDPSFGTNGHTVLDIKLSPPGRSASSDRSRKIDASATHPHGVEILPDGKILASHDYFFDLQQSHGLIIRLEKNGALDLGFNQIGYIPVIHPDYPLNATVLRNVTVQPDGKYLGCGNVYDDSGNPSPAMFVRYNACGELDEQFGDNGFVTVASPLHAHLIQATVLQPNQRILGFGDSLGNEGVMISLEPDGSPNIQFNRGQPLYTELESGSITSWTGAAIQKNGRIVVAGAIGVRGQADIVIARFIDAGFDPEFNDGQGWLRTRLEDGVQLATGLTLQEDGRILICATLPGRKIALLRYHG